jgi:hypothetical protein
VWLGRRFPVTLPGFFGGALVEERHGSFGTDRISLSRDTSAPGPAVLRVDFPADSASERAAEDDGTAHGGAQLYLRWAAGPSDEAYLYYAARFPTGFDFVRGGKLPGLYGGTVTSGQRIPDGTDGFSTRYMWRAGGAGEVYAYLPTSVEHGTSLGRGDWVWPTGTWFSIEQHVRLNTPGRADGLVEVWLNGRMVLSQRHLDFRSTLNLRIEGLFFSTFFGGDDRSWATPRAQSVEFADFRLSTDRVR